jgi:hypothetical protein
MKRKTLLKLGIPVLAIAIASAACGSDGGDKSATPANGDNAAAVTSTTGASTLRAGLTGLLTEHVYLAALATGSALRGDTKGFEAYAAALNGPTNSNTSDLVDAVTSAYGAGDRRQ